MTDNPRFAPVPIHWGRRGTIKIVTSVREAAECMLSEAWPQAGDRSSREAREILLAALEGKASADEARSAFEDAAKAAGLLTQSLRSR